MIKGNYKHESGCCDAVFSFTLENVSIYRLFFVIFVALFSNLLASPALADIAEACDVPKKLTFSTIAHPKVKSEIQPLIKSVYKKLGIEVDFVITASLRDLKLIANGELMGAAVFSEDIIKGMDGIIKVHPPLVTASNMLLCRKGLPCTESVITEFSEDKPIAVSRAMSDVFTQHYPDFDKNNLLVTNEMKNVINLIEFNRVDYGFYPISDHTKGGLQELPTNLDSEFLYAVSSYHVISSELACLEPMIEQVLADTLLALD